jgi:hypothetical protein
MTPTNPALIPMQQLVDALLDTEKPLHPRYLYRLSDLEKEDAKHLGKIWPQVALWRRQALLEDIIELSGSDTLLDFEAFLRQALPDEDPRVRLLGVQALWEYENKNLVPVFILLMEKDPDEEVRAASATALGQYVFLGEIEELPESTLHHIEDRLLKVLNGDDTTKVRRFALESLGYSSRDDIPPLIEKAYASPEKEWVTSALFAMGRSGNQEWKPKVLEMLKSKLPQLRSEAARAAGELEIAQARPILIELLDDPDENTRACSIWSLSQIGGQGAREALERLYEATDDDDDMLGLLDDALENLEFTESLDLLPIIEIPEEGTADVDEDFSIAPLDYEDMDDDEDEYEEDADDEEE